jgi:hypothetical protein
MLKKISLLFTLLPLLVQAQHYDNWNDYFSYNNVIATHYSNEKIYAAAENSIFIYDESNQEYISKSTVDGLSGNVISTIHYSETYQKTIIAYKNGLLEIIADDSDIPVLTVVAIVNKTNIPPNTKAINHILEDNGKLYLSCDYGISVYNIANLVFGDTYYIGAGGAQIKINATAIFNGKIFAATQSNGVLKADVSNPFLINFANWSTVQGGSWKGISKFENELYLFGHNKLFKYNGTSFILENNFSSTIKSLQVTEDKMTIALNTEAFVYDINLNEIHHQGYTTNYDDFLINTAFTTNQGLYLATNKYGLLLSETNDSSSLLEIHPEGPLENHIFDIDAMGGQFWLSHGNHSVYYNAYPLKSAGLSHYQDESWTTIPFDELYNARNLIKPNINPNNPSQVFVSSFKDGLLELIDDTAVNLFNTTNSPLQDIAPIPQEIRAGASAFDKNGLLWLTTGLTETALYSYDIAANTWADYSIAAINPGAVEAYYSKIVIDKNNIKWLGTPYHGVIGYDTQNNLIRNIIDGADDGNLPNIDVRALAIDHNNSLWIGTQTGLVVLYNTTGFFTDDNPTARPIVILDDGIPKLLLDQQWVSDIEVDGSNNKWFATQDAGVFYTSADGKELIYHFTTTNSPLPTNAVDNIAIDDSTGEVFFATDKGLVSFNGVATEASENLDNAYVYPNPVRPNYTGLVTIKNLIADANVKITDITGNLVYEAISEGGTLQWDLTAFGTHRVASGVYLIHITNATAEQTKLIKLMVIN